MLEEAFQKAKVENDKIQSICHRSADTQKYYKSLPKITSVEMEKGFISLFLANIHSINDEAFGTIPFDLRTKEMKS